MPDDLTSRSINEAHACGCVGPQNGQPRCPCMMRGVIQRNGRWIEPERDLGPVTNGSLDRFYGRTNG